MSNAPSQPDLVVDVRLLECEDLAHEVFPGGRNQGFRVFFAPDVHDALWKHAAEDTTVEICGVLVGSWHRDEAGPYVKIIESIRGEGAETKSAEVTFTHQTWAKINAEMDTRFTELSIVGWYHTHPDFGIFLSDRDLFIQEHFFCGPGQVAHVIDPIRQIEGVFVWRDGKPALSPHFWVGDHVKLADPGGPAGATEPPADGHSPASAVDGSRVSGSSPMASGRFGSARFMLYGGVFLLGYAAANIFSAISQSLIRAVAEKRPNPDPAVSSQRGDDKAKVTSSGASDKKP